MSSDNMRRSERIATERPVKLTHSEHTDQGKMIDLSLIGAGVITDSKITENEYIQLEFQLPNAGEHNISICSRAIHAYKVRSNQYLVGLSFEDNSERYLRQIQDYIHFHHRLD